MQLISDSDIPPEPTAEADALARYREHVAGCEECDPGRGRLCHVGAVRHRQWLGAQERQREAGE